MIKIFLTAAAVSLSLIGLTIGAARADVGYGSGSGYSSGSGYGGSSGTAITAPATAIPEPASLALLGGGLVALGVIRRRGGKKD